MYMEFEKIDTAREERKERQIEKIDEWHDKQYREVELTMMTKIKAFLAGFPAIG